MDLLSEEELQRLATGADMDASAATLAPSQAVIAKAQELAKRPTARLLEFEDADLAAFLSHIAGGLPFTKTYTVCGSMDLTFTTISAADAALAASAAVLEELSNQSAKKANRAARYTAFRALMAISPSCIDFIDLRVYGATPDMVLQRYREVLHTASAVAIDLVHTYYDAYSKLIAQLIEGTKNPNFWKPLL